jgi:hypothetical protein
MKDKKHKKIGYVSLMKKTKKKKGSGTATVVAHVMLPVKTRQCLVVLGVNTD